MINVSRLFFNSDNSRSFWLGIEKDENDEYIWKEDGSIVTWTNWGRG